MPSEAHTLKGWGVVQLGPAAPEAGIHWNLRETTVDGNIMMVRCGGRALQVEGTGQRGDRKRWSII